MMALGTSAGADDLRSTSSHVSVSGDDLPSGFGTLVVSYDTTRARMLDDIAQGQSDMWRIWLEDGLKRNDSMYVWLWAEWLRAMGRSDDAYTASVRGILLAKMDMRICDLGPNRSKEALEDWVDMHAWVLDTHPSQDVIKISVVLAVHEAEDVLRDNRPTTGMLCLWAKAKRISQRTHPGQQSRPVVLRATTDRLKSMVGNQRIVIRDFKKDHSYGLSWNDVDMNVIYPD